MGWTLWSALVQVLLSLLSPAPVQQAVKLNHIQVLHAHNSYHTCPYQCMEDLFRSAIGLPFAKALDTDNLLYGFPPITDLLTLHGVRSIEIDIVYDPDGGRYMRRAGPKLALMSRASPNTTGLVGPEELLTPGWKVMHLPDFEFQSSCPTLTACLAEIRAWSEGHPQHDPVFVRLEFKEFKPAELIAPGLLQLEQELEEGLGRSRIFSPDNFRKGYASLKERVVAEGFPDLTETRGKVLVLGLGSSNYRRLLELLRPGGKGGLVYWEPYITQSAAARDGGRLALGPDEVFASCDPGVLPRLATSGSQTATTSSEGSNSTTAILQATEDAPRVALTPARAAQYQELISRLVTRNTIILRATVDEASAAQMPWGSGGAAARGGAHALHTDYPNGWHSSCAPSATTSSPYTLWLQQLRAGRDGGDGSSGAVPVPPRPPVMMSSVCNPVTADSACTSYPPALGRPPADCTCYNEASKPIASS
ncbi:hypothetical protein V8C86DRAFT_322260 [Haematococcus lacustris]